MHRASRRRPDRNNATAVAGVLAAQRSAGCGVEVRVTKEFGGLRIGGVV